MKVAIFSPYATVVPHFETELDVAQQHLDAGDTVEFINCTGELSNCDFNPDRDKKYCQNCIGRREMGLELLQPRVSVGSFCDEKRSRFPLYQLGSNSKTNIDVEPKFFRSVEELKEYHREGFDLGYAALSSLVSYLRDPEPDFETHQPMLRRFIESAWQTFTVARKFLAQRNPDRVYIFNGRFAAMRAVLRACQLAGVDCFLHERGCDKQHYELFKNHMLHDIPSVETIIREHWDSAAENPQRKSIGAQWYINRMQRVETNWHSFVRDQSRGTLPTDWNDSKTNIAIFCSSDDEFVSIGDCWDNPIYENQLDGISKLAMDLKKSAPQVHLTLRVHPNLSQVENETKNRMLGLNFSNLTIIPPDGEIDSYALMKACDTVVTFGSSIGIEAVYWSRPSVLLGASFYQNLGGVVRPENHEQALSILKTELTPQNNQGALMYGYWQQTRGHRHQYFEASDLFEGQFKNKTLYARPKPSISRRIRRKVKSLLKAS